VSSAISHLVRPPTLYGSSLTAERLHQGFNAETKRPTGDSTYRERAREVESLFGTFS
jgi:hypothetical protein